MTLLFLKLNLKLIEQNGTISFPWELFRPVIQQIACQYLPAQHDPQELLQQLQHKHQFRKPVLLLQWKVINFPLEKRDLILDHHTNKFFFWLQ